MKIGLIDVDGNNYPSQTHRGKTAYSKGGVTIG